MGCLAVCTAVLGATGAAQWRLHTLDAEVHRAFDASVHGQIQQTLAEQHELVNLGAVVALTVTVVSALWFHRRVLRRVRVITAALEQWLAGEHRVRIVAPGCDEIDYLAQRCNDLLAQDARPPLVPPSTLTADLDALAQATESYVPAPTSRDNNTASSSDRMDEPRPLRVLVADDGPENRRLMTLVLRKAGVKTANAENGVQAVQAVLGKSFDGTADPTAVPYDLVLLDMQMPIMDGYQAARQLRHEGYTGLIVAVTGSAEREQCIDAGCNEYLPKPVDRDRLLALVRRVQAGELRTAENATA